ncbi:hypothetical protein IT413_04740 [Candidatus Peregrinibacteria bacterium]|nr:hypothetical protein [Candidatus Peregrinibacteria bacterium]
MALKPQNKKHRKQIIAGTVGRDKGHSFEKEITETINSLSIDQLCHLEQVDLEQVIFNGNPAFLLLSYIFTDLSVSCSSIISITAYWLGGLATSGKGDVLQLPNGHNLKSSKSDILIRFQYKDGSIKDVGVSIKTCNNKTPTNAQLYFTTASAFCKLLRDNNIKVTVEAEHAMKMFCGDVGYRPADMIDVSKRKSDPDRWFWEELPQKEKNELEKMFIAQQDGISEVLFKKAYQNDPFPPDYVFHQTRKCENINNVESAIFSIDKLLKLSKKYSGFDLRPYTVKKGRFRGDPNIHLAPRFGVIQMQRGGQKQHPTQLQFNLKAGYFYHLRDLS